MHMYIILETQFKGLQVKWLFSLIYTCNIYDTNVS